MKPNLPTPPRELLSNCAAGFRGVIIDECRIHQTWLAEFGCTHAQEMWEGLWKVYKAPMPYAAD